MNVTVERKMYFQPTATRFDFTNKPSSVCTENYYLINNTYFSIRMLHVENIQYLT